MGSFYPHTGYRENLDALPVEASSEVCSADDFESAQLLTVRVTPTMGSDEPIAFYLTCLLSPFAGCTLVTSLVNKEACKKPVLSEQSKEAAQQGWR